MTFYNTLVLKKLSRHHIDLIMSYYNYELDSETIKMYNIYFDLFYRAVLTRSDLFKASRFALNTTNNLEDLLCLIRENKTLFLELLNNFRDIKLIFSLLSNEDKYEKKGKEYLGINQKFKEFLDLMYWKGYYHDFEISNQDYEFILNYSQLNVLTKKIIENI